MLGATRRTNVKCLPQNAPKLMIIGAQKAGTTALYEYMTKHPHIVGSIPKELHYFNCDKRYTKGIDFYHSHFPIDSSECITFESSPGYLHNELAPYRIYDYNPDIKLIAIVRDPVSRAYSAWNMYKRRFEDNRNWFFDEWVPYCGNSYIQLSKRNDDLLCIFKSYVAEELRHMEEHPYAIIEAPVISHGLYYSQLSIYLRLFKREQIIIVESTQLKTDPIKVLRTIENILEVEPHNWRAEKLVPVFEGDYQGATLDNETRLVLENYYDPYNELLFKLIGERYQWGKQ